MLTPLWKRNDRRASWLIISFSVIIFITITALSRVKLDVDLGFDAHWFARINAILNSIVSVFLIAGLVTVKNRKYITHRNIMLTAMALSILFLLSYVCHHLFTGETRFGDVDHNNIVDETEKAAVGNARMIYYIILGTHIPLAGLILPFILFTAYRALTGDYQKHKKLSRITWPIWLYVAITGVVVYFMISPYY
jgi:putative membrane protein